MWRTASEQASAWLQSHCHHVVPEWFILPANKTSVPPTSVLPCLTRSNLPWSQGEPCPQPSAPGLSALGPAQPQPMGQPNQQCVVLQVMNPHRGKFHGCCRSYSCSNYCNFLRGWTRCLIIQTVGPQYPQVCSHPGLVYNCLILNYVDLKSCQHLILLSESVASLMSKTASLTVNAQATCLLHAEASLSLQAHTDSILVCNLSEWKRMHKSH